MTLEELKVTESEHLEGGKKKRCLEADKITASISCVIAGDLAGAVCAGRGGLIHSVINRITARIGASTQLVSLFFQKKWFYLRSDWL